MNFICKFANFFVYISHLFTNKIGILVNHARKVMKIDYVQNVFLIQMLNIIKNTANV